MVRIISLVCFILLIVLTPPTALVLISQDSIPGDSTYPIKRTMENGILIVASVNPNAKALFQVDRSQRRFTETTKLISKTKSLPRQSIRDLVLQTKEAGDEINNISDSTKKNDLTTKLNSSITQYQAGLQASKTILASNNQSSGHNSNIPSPTPNSSLNPTPTPTPNTSHPSTRPIQTTPIPTQTPKPTPTPTPPDCSKNADPIKCRLDYCESIRDEVLAAQCYQDVLNTIRDIRITKASLEQNSTTASPTPSSTTATPIPLAEEVTPPDFQILKNTLNSINIEDYIQMLAPD